MANKFNNAVLNSYLSSLKKFRAIKFTNIEGNEKNLVKASNLLKVFNVVMPNQEVSAESILYKNIDQNAENAVKVIDLNAFSMSSFGCEDYTLPPESVRSSGGLDGVVYLPKIASFARYYKARHTLKLPNGELVNHRLVDSLLDKAEPIYQKLANAVIPFIVGEERVVNDRITASQSDRGFIERPAVGDRVKVRAYADMAGSFGEREVEDEFGTKISLTNSAFRTYGLPFFKEASYLHDHSAEITKINYTTGLVSLKFSINGGYVEEVKELKNSDSETVELDSALCFHETHLVKI